MRRGRWVATAVAGFFLVTGIAAHRASRDAAETAAVPERAVAARPEAEAPKHVPQEGTGRAAAETASIEAPSPSPAPVPGPVPARPEPAGDVRVVTPPGFTRPPVVSGPLERLPARVTPKPPPGPPKTRVLRPVLVEETGIVKAGEIEVVLPGVVPLAAGATCRDGSEREWPCGARALAAMRAFVGGRGVECVLPDGARSGRFRSACRIGATDLGTWLVRQGWATAGPDAEPFLQAEEAARRDRRGQWSDKVATELPAFTPPVLPPPLAADAGSQPPVAPTR